MSNVIKLFRHSFNYSIGQILLLIASFVSFPLYTRLLPVSEYGLFGLASATITLVVSISKLGLQHSIPRFYSDINPDISDLSRGKYYSTYLLSMFLFGGSATILFLLTLQAMPSAMIGGYIRKLLGVAGIGILFHCGLQTYSQIFRAEQKPGYYNIVNVASRYGSLLFGVVCYFWWGRNLIDLIAGSIICQGFLFAIVTYYLIRTRNIRVIYFSTRLLKESLKYGLPLIGVEMSHLILAFGDRYLIQLFMGPMSLGIYSAGHSIATYAAELITIPMRDAIFPIYMDINARRGNEATKEFLGKAFRYYLLVAFPVICGFLAVSDDLVVLLASSKYSQANVVIPYILVGMFIYGCYSFFGAELFIRKQTKVILISIITSCIIAMALNLLLIPKMGIQGAALSSLGGYISYISALLFFSFKEMRFKIQYRAVLFYFLVSVIMYICLKNIHFGNVWVSLFMKIILGLSFYACPILYREKEIRVKVIEVASAYFFGKHRIKQNTNIGRARNWMTKDE